MSLAPRSTAPAEAVVPRSGPAELRRWLRAGLAWAILGSSLALAAALIEALGLALPFRATGLGRAAAASLFLVVYGALSMPLMAALGWIAGLAPGPAPRSLGWSWWLWNGGLALGAIGMLASQSWAQWPDGWGTPAWPALAVLAAAAVLWAAALGPTLLRPARPLTALSSLALVAALGLILVLGFGQLLGPTVRGAGNAVLGSLFRRGLPELWLLPACLAAAGAVIFHVDGRPLYGRRSLWFGLLAWVFLATVALPRDLVPDLLPAWLGPWVLAASALRLVPVLLLAVAVLGAFVGRRPAAPSSGAAVAERSEAVLRSALLRLAVLGACGLLAGAWADAALSADMRRLVQLSAWDPGAPFPPLAAPILIVQALSLAILRAHGATLDSVALGRFARLAIATALLRVVPAWPLGLAEAAAESVQVVQRLGWASPAPAAAGGFVTWLGLLGLALGWLTTLVWARLFFAGDAVLGAAVESGAGGEGEAGVGVEGEGHASARPGLAAGQGAAPASPAPASAGGMPAGATVLGATVASLALGLMVGVFLPVVDAGAAPAPGPRVLAPGSLAERGRRSYGAEGCVACHSQRVRDAADAALYGPIMRASAYGNGPALAGWRRRAPDLAWVGDRLGDPAALAERLVAVHGPEGRPAFPWLFEAEGPTLEGATLVEYLAVLRSGPPPEDDGS